jgi:hypothetical protein
MVNATESLTEILGLLEPISEQDWHGKWRIQDAIAIIRQQQAEQDDAEDSYDPVAHDMLHRNLKERFVGELRQSATRKDAEAEAPTNGTLNQCREAFEEWYMTRNKRKSVPPRLGETYVHDDPSFAWAAWQAGYNAKSREF